MIKCVQELGIFGNRIHFVCFAHTLHNFLKNIEEVEKASKIISKTRKIVNLVKKSVKLTEKLNNLIIADKLQGKLKKDNITRWSSMFKMIESVLKFKKQLIYLSGDEEEV